MSDRTRLLNLHKVMMESKKKTDAAREKKMAKKAAKKAAKMEAEKTKTVPNFDDEKEECVQIVEKPVTWYNVMKWFKKGIDERISWSVTVPSQWSPKQRMLGKKLVGLYGGEVTEKAVLYICDNWEQMVKDSNGALSGLPTVELLWSIKDRIFPQAERGAPYVHRAKYKRTNDGSEFRPPEAGEEYTDGWD